MRHSIPLLSDYRNNLLILCGLTLVLYIGLAGIEDQEFLWGIRGLLGGLAVVAVLCGMKGKLLTARPGLRFFLFTLTGATGIFTLVLWSASFRESQEVLQSLAQRIKISNMANAVHSLEKNSVFASLISDAPLADMGAMERRYGFRAGGAFTIDTPYMLVKVYDGSYSGNEGEGSSIAVLHNPDSYGSGDGGLRASRTLVLAYVYTMSSKENIVHETIQSTGQTRSYTSRVSQNAAHIYYYDLSGGFVGGETLVDGPLQQAGDYLLAPWRVTAVATQPQNIKDAVQKRLR